MVARGGSTPITGFCIMEGVMMNLFKDIKTITGDNCAVGFEINQYSLTVWISNGCDFGEENETMIPITYDSLDDFSYINFNKYHKENFDKCEIDMNKLSYGFDEDEIEIIHNICKYIKDNKKDILELMEGFKRK